MNRARMNKRRIVFPDGTHPKVLRAAQILVDEGICEPVLIGEEWKVLKRAEEHNVNLRGIQVVEIHDDEQFNRYADDLWKRRQRRGMTLTSVRSWLRNPTVYASMMVSLGDAHGMCGGLATPYADTLRPALQIIGPASKKEVVSGVYVMLFKERRLFFGDCTVNTHPDADTLARIAFNTAQVCRAFGDEPKVAMLSYSDFGEHREDPHVSRIHDAVKRVREWWPDLVVDGEMQADTAVNVELAHWDFPFSAIQGDANVLIFPDLASGNIAYKLLRELGGATAVGPIVVGMDRPVNVLALGSTVPDIVNMAAITANQVLDLVAPAGAPPAPPSPGA